MPRLHHVLSRRRDIPDATVDFATSLDDWTNRITYTEPLFSLAHAAPDNALLIGIYGLVSGTTASAISGVSITGGSGTVYAATALTTRVVDNTKNSRQWWGSLVPDEDEAVVAVTWAATQDHCNFAIWEAQHLQSLGARDSDDVIVTDGSDPTANLAVLAGGIVCAWSYASGTDSTYAWTGITEEFELIDSTNHRGFGGGSLAFAAANPSLNVICAPSLSPGSHRLSVASFR